MHVHIWTLLSRILFLYIWVDLLLTTSIGIQRPFLWLLVELLPIENVVVLISHSVEQIFELPSLGIIIWFFVEFQGSAIAHELYKFFWYVNVIFEDARLPLGFDLGTLDFDAFHIHFTKVLYWCIYLHFFDNLILFIPVLGLHSLPGQTTLQKVDQDEAEALKVITATLLYSNMRV